MENDLTNIQTFTLSKNKITHKVDRYPWEALTKIGDIIAIRGVDLQTARLMAYAYAKRHGWKVSGSIKGKDLILGRVG
jgi:hypothetical protein